MTNLRELYTDPKSAGSFGGVNRLYREAKKHGFTKKDVKDYLASEATYSLHRDRRKNFKRNRIVVHYRNQQHEADLADMSTFSKENDGFKFILFNIDVFSKFLHCVPIKNKSAQSIKAAFEVIHADGYPTRLRTDRGLEFQNSLMKKYYDDNEIIYFTSQNSTYKSATVERVQRTVKARLFRYRTLKGTSRWVDVLPDIISGYNDSYHRSIKMTPNEAQTAPEAEIYKNLYGEKEATVKPRLAVGDQVRTAYTLGPLEKGFYPTFSDTVETVKSIIKKKKPLYRLKDYRGKENPRRFQQEELVRVTDPYYRIEKVLKTKIVGGKTLCLVKWLGYDASHNSWLDETEIAEES